MYNDSSIFKLMTILLSLICIIILFACILYDARRTVENNIKLIKFTENQAFKSGYNYEICGDIHSHNIKCYLLDSNMNRKVLVYIK